MQCKVCNAPVGQNEKGLPLSEYWRVDKKHTIIAVFCGPVCSLIDYQNNKEEKI